MACVLLGSFWGFAWRAEVRSYLEAFVGRPNSDLLPSGHYTVGTLRRVAPRIELGMFGLFYLMAALFAGLHVWARKFPVPALVTGIVIFVQFQAACALSAFHGFFKLGRGPEGLMNRLGFLVWTAFFLAVWIVAIREARGRDGSRPRTSSPGSSPVGRPSGPSAPG